MSLTKLLCFFRNSITPDNPAVTKLSENEDHDAESESSSNSDSDSGDDDSDICESGDCVVTQELSAHSVDPRPPVAEVDETVHADEESSGASVISKLFGDFFSV